MSFVINYFNGFGRRITLMIGYTINVVLMIYLSFRAAVFDQKQSWRTVLRVVSAQVYFTGWQAMPIITVLALASGSIVVIQASMQLGFLGASNMLSDLLVIIVVREVAPLMTALIIIARSGTAVASELGNMRVNCETEALEVMGINPLSYVVFPRILGGFISVICLSIYFTLISLVGGFFVTQLVCDVSFEFYTSSLVQALATEDIMLFLLKNIFSGLIIFVVCCYQGFQVRQSPHEVPRMTVKAVINSIIYVISFNMIVTTLFYLNQIAKMRGA